MNKERLLSYLERIGNTLRQDTMLVVYGSSAFILMDEPDRTSLDVPELIASKLIRYDAIDRSDIQYL